MSRVEVLLACLDSPDWARFLLTVRAAISSARSSLSPRSLAEDLTCSYCRSRFLLHCCCGIPASSRSAPVQVFAHLGPTPVCEEHSSVPDAGSWVGRRAGTTPDCS